MTPFHTRLIYSILTSLVILPLLLFPVKTHFRMYLLLIIHRTHQMSACHYIVKRTHLPLKLCPICHLSFMKMQRVNFLASHLPLCMIHQIMRMPMNILNFLIVVVMIFVLLHFITMLIHSLLIFISHWSLMIYLLTEWKPRRMSRHFSLGRWLCQALVVLRLVPLLIKKNSKHPRFLITLCFTLKINQTPIFRFLHFDHMIPLLKIWRNITQRAHLQSISCWSFSCSLGCHSPKSMYVYHM